MRLWVSIAVVLVLIAGGAYLLRSSDSSPCVDGQPPEVLTGTPDAAKRYEQMYDAAVNACPSGQYDPTKIDLGNI